MRYLYCLLVVVLSGLLLSVVSCDEASLMNASGEDVRSEDIEQFLSESFVQFYTKDSIPDVKKLEEYSLVLMEKNDIPQQLKVLYLWTSIYEKANDLQMEVRTIEEAIQLALRHKESAWLFYLYGRLANMYYRTYDVSEYVKYQTLANKYIEDLDMDAFPLEGRLLMAKNYLYTKKYDEACAALESIDTDSQHWLYAQMKVLLGITYSKMNLWKRSVSEVNEALDKGGLSKGNMLLCYVTLAYCHSQIGDLESALYFKRIADSYDIDNLNGLTQIAIYKAYIEISLLMSDANAEKMYMQKMVKQYESIIQQLNDVTLDEAIQIYTKNQERNFYNQNIKKHRYVILLITVSLISSILFYLNLKKKQAYNLLYLQTSLNSMETLNSIKDETKQMILRDFEIGKKIALLKQSKIEKYNKLLNELDKLNVTESNELLNMDWEKFYQHIDIAFDNFYSSLIEKYGDLNDKEVQLCCMLKAGFKTDEIAALWLQSVHSVHKCKTNVRKKICTPEGADIIKFIDSVITLQG